MKFFNKKLILAVAAATIVFATGCTKKPSRPTPDQTIIGGTGTTSTDFTTATTTPSAWNQTPSTTGVMGGATTANNTQGFGNQNLFPVNSGAAAAQSDTLIQRPPTDGGTRDGDQIRNIPSLQPIFFDFDRYAIKTSEFGKIQALKDYLDKNPTQRVLIEGHCDWRGTAEYNMALGDRRANAVKQYAIRIGIPPNKIQTKSLGSTQATEQGTEAQMAKDRRGEIVILVK